MATVIWVVSEATPWVKHIEDTKGMSALENHWCRRMLARLGGQHKLQVITKLGTSSLPSRLSTICLRGAVAQQVGLTCIVAKPAFLNYIWCRGFHSSANQYLKNHNPKIYGLTPFQLLSNCKGTIWLLEHLDCSRIADLRGQKQGT